MVSSISDEHQLERNLDTALSTLRKSVNASQIGVAGRITIGHAVQVAMSAHEGQQRDEGDPYIIHPVRVATDYLERWPHRPANFVAVAVLHDVLEDDGITKEDLQETFGRVIANSVGALSKNKELPDEEMRREYRERLQALPNVILQVKVVDRLDNLRSCFLKPDEQKVARYVQYSREHYLPLARQAGEILHADMESVLNELTQRFSV